MNSSSDTPLLSKDGSRHVTDERINTITHMIGTAFALLGFVVLVVKAAAMGKTWHIVGFSIYGLTLVTMFLCSTLHHGVHASAKVEHWLRQCDYFSIFLLIAGSTMPFCLVLMRTPMGWSICGVIWFLAIVGVTIKGVWPTIPKWVTLTLYLSMGWMTLAFVPAIWQAFPFPAIALMAAGGLLYTVGGIIFICEKPNPVPGIFGFHEIWHLFVVAASCAHYAFMYGYMLHF